MTQDFLPVPSELPRKPDDVDAKDGKPTKNTLVGIGMFGRTEGATLTELRECCNAYLDQYKADGMPKSTANQTKDKLKDHWQWRDDITLRLRAEKTEKERGGEAVYKLNRPTAGAANTQPEAVEGDVSAAEINLETSNMQTTNTILYGPPGTGKTFTTIDEAIKILDPEFYAKHKSERESLKERFDELVANKRIRFVTFHQSFSYEDFVEGIRAETDEAEGGQIQYVIEKGVFKAICEDASKPIQSATAKLGVSESPRIWKISIDGTGDSATRQYCLKHG